MFAVIDRWRNSNMSQKAICKEAGGSFHVFKYWLNRQRTEQAVIIGIENKNSKPENKGTFIHVSVDKSSN